MGTAFVYGTLMADEVVKLLLSRVPPQKPATLRGFVRYRVKNQVFPAIISADAASEVKGKVLLELTPKELHILDTYESEEYYRQPVKPVLEDGSEVQADVYVWKDQYRSFLVPSEWSYDEWRHDHLHTWVSRMTPDGAHPDGDLIS